MRYGIVELMRQWQCFKNRICALMDGCPFKGASLILLQAACARTAAQTIANLTSVSPGLSEKRQNRNVFRKVVTAMVCSWRVPLEA